MCSASLLLSNPVEEVRGRKPHTKLQERCLSLADKLPPLTDRQRAWARNRMPAVGYYVTRGYHGRHSGVWCQECGQFDEVTLQALAIEVGAKGAGSHICSRCGRKLDVKNWYCDKVKDQEHNWSFLVVTTYEDMQVVRCFNWYQVVAFKGDTVDHVYEVFQIWFEPKKGKKVIISKDYTRSWYYFRWRQHSKWKVKANTRKANNYYSGDDVYSLEKLPIYPVAKVLPVLRRNGWSNRMFRLSVSPVDIWRGILTDPIIEGLVKNRQYDVVDYWYRTGGPRKDRSQWLPAVRVCNRHHYVIRDASMWFDYIDLLNYFHKDIHNPYYVCPENLKDAHDRLVERKTRIEKAEELRRNIANASKYEDEYRDHRGMFFGICFGNRDIMITVIGSVREMAEEGAMMHHCVYANGYYDRRKHPDSLILSARDREGRRLETVEVNTRLWKVVQSRGLQNGTTRWHDEIVRLVTQNMGKLRKVA